MRYRYGLLLAVICCLGMSGCNAKVIEEMQAQLKQLESENASLKAQLAAASSEANQARKEADQLKKQITNYQEIEKGYEEARVKINAQMEAQMKVLAPLLGLSGDLSSPFPPFEELKNSDWVSKMAPSGGGGANLLKGVLKGLENIKELKGIEAELIKEYLGDEKDKKKKPQPE